MDLGRLFANHHSRTIRQGSCSARTTCSPKYPAACSQWPHPFDWTRRVQRVRRGHDDQNGQGRAISLLFLPFQGEQWGGCLQLLKRAYRELDEPVLDAVAAGIFSDRKIELLRQKALDTSSDARQHENDELQQCEDRLAEVRQHLSNHYDAIEDQRPSERDPELASRIRNVGRKSMHLTPVPKCCGSSSTEG